LGSPTDEIKKELKMEFMQDSLFEMACDKIRTEYKTLGYKNGWRFLYTSRHTLSPNTKLLLIGLNPGGYDPNNRYPEEYASFESGNAYRDEPWGLLDSTTGNVGLNDLQKQLSALYEKVAQKINNNITRDYLMDNTLAANFYFYRSHNSEDLENKDRAKEFSLKLWSLLLQKLNPTVIITYADDAYKGLGTIYKRCGYSLSEQKKATGWGKTNYCLMNLLLADKSLMLIKLPHLSTYKIFCGRYKYSSAVEDICNNIAERLSLVF
jgi:hypothetical protein